MPLLLVSVESVEMRVFRRRCHFLDTSADRGPRRNFDYQCGDNIFSEEDIA